MSFTDVVKKLLYFLAECAAQSDHSEADRARALDAQAIDEAYSYDEQGREVS